MSDDRGFQPIRRPERDEESLLEELAARKGVGRLQQDAARSPEKPSEAPQSAAGQEDALRKPRRAKAGPEAPTPRSSMKAMNLELPDYVMQQLKERALRQDCSVRHLIMKSLAAQGIEIRKADMIADGRRLRGKLALR